MRAKVYTGKSLGGYQLDKHPLNEVKEAKAKIDYGESFSAISNSADFCSAVKYYGELMGFDVEFFVDDVSVGNSLKKVFEHLNQAISYLDEITNR